MTDKQIIIDSVDVSECIECDINKIKDGYDALCCLTNCSCKHHPYCYYKQLKRKEQECENLKQTLKEIKEIAKNGCYDDCNMPLDELVIILQKISEVIDD